MKPFVCASLLAITGWLGQSGRAADAPQPTLDASATVSPGETDAAGVVVHTVESAYQSQKTKIKVLLPSALDKTARYPVLYVLPVEPMEGVQWGDGLREVEKHDLHNKYGLICVLPTFAETPWYADHPQDARIRQESYFLKVVVPFVDRTYPTLAKPEGRLLVGFSKSGWGAFSLLLRNGEVFGKAAAWDAPLMAERPDKWNMADVFGAQENFEKYQVSALLKEHAENLTGQARLIHFGYGNFREHHESVHRLMDELKIAHQYRDGPKRAHSWHSGWLPEAVQMLVGEASESEASPESPPMAVRGGGQSHFRADASRRSPKIGTVPTETAEAPRPPPPIEVFFSPKGGCMEAIIKEVKAAKRSILVQAYWFTSEPIAQALVAAHKRGVKVQVILDRSRTEMDNTQADYIVQKDIPTFIDNKHTTAHNKVVIIDGSVVITGSFNFTEQAEEDNAENLLVIRDQRIAEKFTANWKAHAAHSGRYVKQ